MIGLLVALLEHTLVGGCLVSIILFFVSAAALLRLLPALVAAGMQALRVLMLVSLHLYRRLLTELAPLVESLAGIDILQGLPRIGATSGLSLCLGLAPLWVLHLPLTIWTGGLLVLHGAVIGLVWGELEEPGDLHLGGRIR